MSSDERRSEDGEDGVAETDGSAADPDATAARVSEPSDAFGALGNEIRMGILETLLDRVADDRTDSRATFTELFEASGLETSAQFAYHLDRLVGPYLRKTEEGYEFTYAGLKIARAIATGRFTKRVDRDPVGLSEACPFCDRDGLEARSTDNVVTIACVECDRMLLSLGFPPAGLESHGDRLPAAFDAHHRYRLAMMREGVCPECSGDVAASLVQPSADTADALPERMTDRVQAALECRRCGHAVRCPVTLALLEHPAVHSFYDDHGATVRDRPIWNVGHEWAETVLSTDPLAVRVVAELDDEVLALYVDASLRVVDVQRGPADGDGEAD